MNTSKLTKAEVEALKDAVQHTMVVLFDEQEAEDLEVLASAAEKAFGAEFVAKVMKVMR